MTVTNEQIEALRGEAGTAGDLPQARVCDAALGLTAADMEEILGRDLFGEERAAVAGMTQAQAVAECERVMADAAAQQ